MKLHSPHSQKSAIETSGARRAHNEVPLFPLGAVEQPIPQRFEEQVSNFPSRQAVVADHVSLTFEQLNRAANRLARQILECRGLGEEAIVLLMRQGAAFVVAALGVLKAGKIYVPLDPDDPQARIEAMVSDAGALLILTDDGSRAVAEHVAATGTEVLKVEIAPGDSEPDPGVKLHPHQPAYIYYTSGSTGEPKGVVDTHRNVLHNVMRYTNSLRITADDRLTLLQAPSFSGAVSSLFAALLNGAAVYPYDIRAQGIAGLTEWIRSNRLSIYHSVPSIFRTWATDGGTFPDLRVIRLEGDQASDLDVELYRRHFSKDSILVNGLGTTETGLCRQFFVNGSTDLPHGRLPVGYPVEDMEVVLLDELGNEIGREGTGEIAVRSRYLAQGYWRRPGLTSARFVAEADGRQIYRTGDVGRWLTESCLLHLGRADSQVKIRGSRVDLGEVETALQRIEGIREAAVTVDQDPDGENVLVGHIVQECGVDIGSAEIRKQLSEKLPGYMAPGRIVFLDQLPVTPYSKIDRRALAAELNGQARAPTIPPEPQTLTQKQLSAIWRSLLQLDEISIDDDFFDLGGHSLLAMRMLLEVDKKLGRRLAPGIVIEAPTVRQLALVIDEPRPGRSLVVLQPAGPDPAFIWLPGADGDVFVFRKLARSLGPDVPMFALEPPGAEGASTPIDSVEDLAARYVDELLRARPDGAYCLGGYCFGGFVAFEMAKQLENRGKRVPLLVLLDCDGQWRTVSGWRGALGYHVSNLARQRASAWPAYLVERLQYRREEMAEAIRKLTGRANSPASAQRVVQASRRASRSYNPTPWPGRLVYLRSRQRSYADPAAFWRALTPKIDLYEIEGADTTMFSEPSVTRLAEILRVLRQEALAETLGQPPLIAATK